LLSRQPHFIHHERKTHDIQTPDDHQPAAAQAAVKLREIELQAVEEALLDCDLIEQRRILIAKRNRARNRLQLAKQEVASA
jgi:hypothetical protein